MQLITEIKRLATILTVILLGFFLYTKLAGPIPFSVTSTQTTKSNLFSVSGTGKAVAIPNTAIISLGATETAATVSNVQDKLNVKTDNIIAALKKLGIEEKSIKTVNYTISPNYDFTAGQRITGYNASQNLEIKTNKAELVNRVLDAASAAGANVVGGVNFTFDDEVKSELENQARKEAVGKAKTKAQSLANAAGIRLGKIMDIQESTANQSVPMTEVFKAGDAAGNPTNITPGENSVEITVTLFYETL